MKIAIPSPDKISQHSVREDSRISYFDAFIYKILEELISNFDRQNPNNKIIFKKYFSCENMIGISIYSSPKSNKQEMMPVVELFKEAGWDLEYKILSLTHCSYAEATIEFTFTPYPSALL